MKVPVLNTKSVIVSVCSLCWLLMLSAELVETDVYRYAAAVLALIALNYHVRNPSRPPTNWLGWLCMAWGGYVVVRFAIIYATTRPHQIGSMDWLFAFPFFFPILGVAFSITEKQIERIIAAFFAIALLMLCFTTKFQQIFAGEVAKPLIMNNQIHSSVACGLILLAASFWLLHYLSNGKPATGYAKFAFVAAPLIVILCLIAIYGGKSKGVWLALIISLPVAGLTALTYLRARIGVLLVAAAAAALIVSVYVVRQNMDRTAGPTAFATISMLGEMDKPSDVGEAMIKTIDSTSTPTSMDERLQLWYNAGQLISGAPFFGWGNAWLEKWEDTTRYPNVGYDLMHNGFLEILIRNGAFGAIVLSIILAALIVSVWRAARAGLVPRAAFHTYVICLFFFSLTLLSNSKNRLAIGESLSLFSSAFACWCNMRLDGKTARARENRLMDAGKATLQS